jgi:hypothetical protein
LGPFKQALVAGFKPEFLPLGAERSWEGPKSCSNKMKYDQNKKCIMLNAWFIQLKFTPQVQSGFPATPHTEARRSQMMKTKRKIEKKHLGTQSGPIQAGSCCRIEP